MYAAKIADILDIYLADAQQILAYSAKLLAEHYANNAHTNTEASRLIQQNRYFNSIVMADTKGKVIASAPTGLNLNNTSLQTAGARQSLAEQKPLVSNPFHSALGNYIISISSPVISNSNNYLGFISGTLHLKRDSILSELLGHHFASEQYRVYVYNSDGVLLYHRDQQKIGENISDLITGQVKAATSNTAKGMAITKHTHWHVVVERTEQSLQTELHSQLFSAVMYLLPASILLGISIWWLGARLSAALSLLVKLSADFSVSQNRAAFLRITSPIKEIQQLKRALLTSWGEVHSRMDALDKASQTDPLTKLANRRALDAFASALQNTPSHQVVLAIDIDHFKHVNDNYGHARGDLVLCHLAQLLRENTRSNDFVCRNGGEEFLIITALPIKTATELAERLRQLVATADFGLSNPLTISIGVAAWDPLKMSLAFAIQQSDLALYQAKSEGRNRVVVATVNESRSG